MICRQEIFKQLKNIEAVPSVQIQHTPRVYNSDKKEEEEDPEAREDRTFIISV